MFHPVECFFLLIVQRSQLAAGKETAKARKGGKRSSKIMHCPGDKVGTLLIVFLKPQVGMKKALQEIIPIRAERAYFR